MAGQGTSSDTHMDTSDRSPAKKGLVGRALSAIYRNKRPRKDDNDPHFVEQYEAPSGGSQDELDCDLIIYQAFRTICSRFCDLGKSYVLDKEAKYYDLNCLNGRARLLSSTFSNITKAFNESAISSKYEVLNKENKYVKNLLDTVHVLGVTRGSNNKGEYLMESFNGSTILKVMTDILIAASLFLSKGSKREPMPKGVKRKMITLKEDWVGRFKIWCAVIEMNAENVNRIWYSNHNQVIGPRSREATTGGLKKKRETIKISSVIGGGLNSMCKGATSSPRLYCLKNHFDIGALAYHTIETRTSTKPTQGRDYLRPWCNTIQRQHPYMVSQGDRENFYRAMSTWKVEEVVDILNLMCKASALCGSGRRGLFTPNIISIAVSENKELNGFHGLKNYLDSGINICVCKTKSQTGFSENHLRFMVATSHFGLIDESLEEIGWQMGCPEVLKFKREDFEGVIKPRVGSTHADHDGFFVAIKYNSVMVHFSKAYSGVKGVGEGNTSLISRPGTSGVRKVNMKPMLKFLKSAKGSAMESTWGSYHSARSMIETLIGKRMMELDAVGYKEEGTVNFVNGHQLLGAKDNAELVAIRDSSGISMPAMPTCTFLTNKSGFD